MRALVSLLFVAFSACKGAEQPPDDQVTWYADVTPIVQTHCARCHNGAGVGPGDFTDPEIVRALAPLMASRIELGEMPPPVADPNCNDFQGSEYLSVPPQAVDTLRAWVDAGHPLGDPEDEPVVPPPPFELEAWDLEVRMPVAYAPTFSDPAQPGNEYRCFAAEHGRDEPFFITGLAPVIDQARILHHLVVYRLKRTDLPGNYDPETGVDCISMTGVGEGMLGGWAPGALPMQFPDGVGMLVKPEEVLVFQMHYFRSGPDAVGLPDQSGYRFSTTSSVETVVTMAPIGPTNFRIPAGDPAYTHADGDVLPAPYFAKIWGVFPHMHMLGSGYKMWIERGGPGGPEECVIGSDRYDFGNQLTYGLREPITVHAGDYMAMSCTWDNSAENPNQFYDPPQEIRYGERTDEEMCYMFSLISYGFE